MIRIASFNVENLFARPKAFRTNNQFNEPILDSFNEASDLLALPNYTDANKDRIIQLFIDLEVYRVDANTGLIKRKRSSNPRWVWFRKNRGSFDVDRKATGIEITANGRQDWIGWLELAVEPTDERSTQITAKVINDVAPDILGIVEAEDRPSLLRFNEDLLNRYFKHVMLVDGNDRRGIDVGIMTKQGFPIGTIRSNVDAEDGVGTIFSRDCPEYQIALPNGKIINVLVNHFKSQSGGGGPKRRRQAKEVRNIVNRLVANNQHVIVMGDLNEGPAPGTDRVNNFADLYNNNSPLIDVFSLNGFNLGPRLGTFNTCSIRNRLDYIFISESLKDAFIGGEIYRQGLWGKRVSRPTNWVTYPEMQRSEEQASDHALVYIDLDETLID